MAACAACPCRLESQLIEYGNKLLKPPSSVDQLLQILNEVEIHLSKVERSPSKSMCNAMSTLIKALVAKELLWHHDEDVKLSVASCIIEIGIKEPESPYTNAQMKEILQLIVGLFEKLYDTSSHLYHKRALILKNEAKAGLCVFMLDWESDELIVEMFHHFLNAIRGNQERAIHTSMERIMVLILKEREKLSTELLRPLLNSVKKENQDVLPIAKSLAETVLIKCASEVKPYLMQAVLSLKTFVHDYSEVVAVICQETW